MQDREYDYEGDMAISQLRSIIRNATQLLDQLEPTTNLPEWLQSKITLAQDYISTANNYMQSTEEAAPPQAPIIIPSGYERMKKEDWSALIPQQKWNSHFMQYYRESLEEVSADGKSKLDEATTIHLPRKYMHAGSEMEDQVSAAIHKAAGSPKMHSIEFKFGIKFEVERDGKKDQKLTDILRKNLKEEVAIPMYVQEAAYSGNIGMMELAKFYMKSSDTEKKKLQELIKKEMFKDAWKLVQTKTGVKLVGTEFAEDVAANSVASGGVDMNPTGKSKWDKRSKFHVDHMFKRADGTKYKKNNTSE